MANFIAKITEQSGLTCMTFDLSCDVVLDKNLLPIINSRTELLPVEAIEKPGGYNLIYDAGSELSLSKYLRLNKLEKAQTIKLIKGICFPISNAKSNGLFMENFSFDSDHIFVDTRSDKIKLTYFPFETGQQLNRSLKTLMAKIFEELLNPIEDNSEYIYRIMDCYKQSSFSIATLYSLLEILGENENTLKRRKKDRNSSKSKQGLWSRLFNKKHHVPIPEPLCEEMLDTPITFSRQSNGTELLIPYNETGFIPKTKNRYIEINIVFNGMTNQTEIKSFPCVIGRSQKEANVVLEDSSVSRKHAIVDYVDGGFIITDNDSSNGLVVNGIKLSAGASQLINTGDIIKLGRIEIKIENISGV